MRYLSRQEMKFLLGGKKALDHCTFQGMCANFPTIEYSEGEGPAADLAQSSADGICMSLGNCCTDVDCPGAQ